MKKQLLTKVLTGMGILASVTMLAACSNGSSSSSTAGGDAKLAKKVKPTTIMFWHAMSGDNGKAIEQIAKDFNAVEGKKAGIKVKTVFQDIQIASKVKMVSKSKDNKNAPDIIQTVGMDIPTISKLPQIVAASDVIKQNKNSGVSQSEYYPQLTRAFTFKNKLIGLPMSASTLMLYYNKTLLKKAGITATPKTIAEVAAAAKAVGETSKATGLSAPITRYELVNFIVSQYPTSYFGNNQGGRSKEMTKVTIKDDGTLKKFLDQWQKVVKSGSYKDTSENANEEFSSGINAMTLLSSSRLEAIKQLVNGKFEYGVTNLPKVNSGDTSGASAGGASLVLYNRGDKNKMAAAWKFMAFATSAKEQAKWSQATGYIPVNKGSEKLTTMKTFYASHPQFKTALDQLKASSPKAQEPFDLVNNEVNTIITDAMQKFDSGKLSEEQTINQIVKKCNDALKEYHRANG